MSRQFRAIAIVVALAAIAFVVISHRHHRNTIGIPVDVLVAKKLIQKGTSGDAIRTTAAYAVRNIPQSEIRSGAIVNPATLTGKVALVDIGPDQQLTMADFGPAVTGPGPSGDERAIVVANPKEIGGKISAGSRVDIWVGGSGRGAPRRLYLDLRVLNVDTTDGGVTVRATPQQAGRIVYLTARTNARLVLRLRK